MLATDIASYSSPHRNDETRLHLRDAHYKVLADALTGSGVPWDMCRNEDQGDGTLVIVPPTIPAAGLIDPFPTRLARLIRRYNRMASDAARMQLRATIHVGPVYADEHGFTSADITYLFRMLDARPLRRALTSPGTELALAVSGYVHDNMVLHHPSLADPAHFTSFRAIVKRTTIRGWLYTPGRD
jgi:hypothetical protein